MPSAFFRFIPLLALAPLSAQATTYVFLLAGQSNMSGRGLLSESTFVADPRIQSYGDGLYGSTPGIAQATDTLRHDNVINATPSSAVGPGGFFASALLPALGATDKILLVNRAWGGTSTAQWLSSAVYVAQGGGTPNPGGYPLTTNLYNTALTDFNAAMTAVTTAGDVARVGGILWLQGEADVTGSGMFMTANYHTDTVAILDGFRDAIDTQYGLGDNATKIVMGEIAQQFPNSANLRAEQLIIAAELGAGFASSAGLATRTTPDTNTHFTAASQAILGRRMETAFVAVPEPSTYGLLGAGTLAAVAFVRRRRKRAL